MILYTPATWLPVTNQGGPMTTHNYGLVLHVEEDNSSPYGYFNNPVSQVSSHFWVGKAGEVEQYVSCDVIAWAQAAGNSLYLSVETEGYTYEALTPAQIHSLALLYRWGHDMFSWPFVLADVPGEKGFAWHGMGGVAWGDHPGCPGDLRRGQRPEIIQLAQGAVVVPPPPPPVPPPVVAPPFPGRLLVLETPYMSGSDVHTWQARMQQRGWSLAVDGVYGPVTHGVCLQFQQEKGLGADGIVGPITWAAAWTAPVT
jgi:Putative peptidoglycan binding domain/N-acetylmuramoyl-L-alanine amidase